MENLREAQLIMKEILDEINRICEKYNIEYWLSDGTLLGVIRHKGFIPWDDDLDISMRREEYEKFLKVAHKELGEKYIFQNVKEDKLYDVYGVPTKIRYKDSLLLENEYIGRKFHQGIFVDIFPMDKIPVNKKMYKCLKNFTVFIMFAKTPLKPFNSVRNILRNIFKIPFKLIKFKIFIKLIEKLFNRFSKFEEKYGYGIDTYFYEEYKEKDIFPLKKAEFEGNMYPIPNKSENILKDLYGDYMKLPQENERTAHSIKIEIYKEG